MTPLADVDLESALLIRHFELTLLELFDQGVLQGTTHTCLGQEYIPVAVSGLLDPRDYVFSNHRGHGHYLARFADPDGLLAEIMGREGAVCHGVGGSQHILRERYLSTGIQGESLPVATGVALRLRATEPGRLCCVYIGDGTWGEGAVYEALNMASLWRLPLLVVVEHNGIAQSTPTERQLAGTIAGRAAAFGIAHVLIESTDINDIRASLAPLVDKLRSGGGPLVVEFRTQRLGPHSKGDDSRSVDEIRAVERDDWCRRYAAVHATQFERSDALLRQRVRQLAADVAARPPSVWSER